MLTTESINNNKSDYKNGILKFSKFFEINFWLNFVTSIYKIQY